MRTEFVEVPIDRWVPLPATLVDPIPAPYPPANFTPTDCPAYAAELLDDLGLCNSDRIRAGKLAGELVSDAE